MEKNKFKLIKVRLRTRNCYTNLNQKKVTADIHEALDICNIWHGHHHDIHGGQLTRIMRKGFSDLVRNLKVMMYA